MHEHGESGLEDIRDSFDHWDRFDALSREQRFGRDVPELRIGA